TRTRQRTAGQFLQCGLAATAGSGGRERIEIVRDAAQTRRGGAGGFDDASVRSLSEGCARFLQCAIAVVNRPARGRECTGRRAGALRRLEFRAGLRQGRGRGGERAACVGAHGGLARGRFLGGRLRAFPRVESAIEGEAIVALIDGVGGVLERGFGGGELFARVHVRTRAAGGVDGGPRLLEFLVGRIAARGIRERCDHCERHHGAT